MLFVTLLVADLTVCPSPGLSLLWPGRCLWPVGCGPRRSLKRSRSARWREYVRASTLTSPAALRQTAAAAASLRRVVLGHRATLLRPFGR